MKTSRDVSKPNISGKSAAIMKNCELLRKLRSLLDFAINWAIAISWRDCFIIFFIAFSIFIVFFPTAFPCLILLTNIRWISNIWSILKHFHWYFFSIPWILLVRRLIFPPLSSSQCILGLFSLLNILFSSVAQVCNPLECCLGRQLTRVWCRANLFVCVCSSSINVKLRYELCQDEWCSAHLRGVLLLSSYHIYIREMKRQRFTQGSQINLQRRRLESAHAHFLQSFVYAAANIKHS